ncbi:MAG: phosphoribosylformylglycinamidine synthase I [Candidatus Eremiobacteraeota bacterium]|nr:phosphoribosylformylglycinamidine synthase I [Candidatus Eremiobacteraeota bacterium]
MNARVAIIVFPGSNSEEETLRVAQDAQIDARLVHWSDAASLHRFDAYILPGGFAYEDRIRAGAIAAHDRILDGVIDGALAGKLVLGICNGAQVLLEAGLVPGTGEVRRPTAAFTYNAPSRRFICKRVHMKLSVAPQRCAITAHLPLDTLLPAWAAHGEGRLAAPADELRRLQTGAHVTFVYAHPDGSTDARAVPNGSALGAAALCNIVGNVLAVMPHPERDAWTFQHSDDQRLPARGSAQKMLAPSGGFALFTSIARALRRG